MEVGCRTKFEYARVDKVVIGVSTNTFMRPALEHNIFRM